MRVLLITPQYSPDVGGCARLLQGAVDYLHEQGHRVEVLTFGAPLAAAIRAFDEAQSYRIHRVAPQRVPGTSSLAMFSRLIALNSRGRFDVVFCGVAFPSAALAFFCQHVMSVPYVIYSHGEDITVVKDSRCRTALFRRVLHKARARMANSSFTRREMAAVGVPLEDISVVPPGIDVANYENPDARLVEALRLRFGLSGKRVILTVARLAERKGHDMIIQALPSLCRDMPDVHYLIVGKGDPSRLQNIAQERGVADRVTIVEYVPDAELPALFHLCDVYAMVSRWDPTAKEVEGFGIVYLEAGACGKPCVAGSAGGATDAVEDGVTGFIVDPLDLSALQKALHTLLTDHKSAVLMGAAGRSRAKGCFDKTTVLRRMEQVIASAAGVGSASRADTASLVGK